MKPKNKSRTWTLAIAAVLSIVAAQPCDATVPNPTPTDLGILAGYQYSAPNALNASAQVVGECAASPETDADPPQIAPFIWAGGTMSALPLPSGFASGTAVDINASGQIVGFCWNWYWDDSDWENEGWFHTDTQACRWQRGSSGWSVTLLGAPAAKDASEGLLINDAGQIYAKTWATDGSAQGSAVLKDGAWIELKDTYGDLVPWGFRDQMNESGQVLAWSQYGGGLVLWTDGTPTTIVPYPYLGQHTLDNLGRVAGMYGPDEGDPHTAYVYQPGATPALQTLPCSTGGPGDPVLWLSAMNDSGQVLFTQQAMDASGTFAGTDLLIGGLPLGEPTTPIGRVPAVIMYYDTPFMNANGELAGIYAGGPWGAYYASATAGVVLLNGLGGLSNWSVEVRAMNDSGVIVGTSPAADGYIHAVLWGTVTYSWSGVLQPVNPDGSSVFKAGSTVPVKFKLTGASAGITDLVATLTYARLSNGVAGPVNEATTSVAASSGNQFRYDPTAGQYVFNWSTKGQTAGTYRLFINLGDGVSHTVDIGLK